MLRNYTILLILLCGFLAKAQDHPLISLDKTFGTSNTDEAHVIVQNLEGNLAVAGKTNLSYRKGEDIYFAVLDTSGEVLIEKSFGTNYDEEVFDLLQNVDGTYFLAGYVKQKKERYAKLIRIDEQGKVLMDTILGKGSLNALLGDEQGNVYATGESAGNLLVVKFNKNGQVQWTLNSEKGIGQAISKGQNSTVAITGFEKIDGKEYLFLAKYDLENQQLLWKVAYLKDARGMDLLVEEDGSISVTGIKFPSTRKEDLLFFKVDHNGKEIINKSYEKKGKDGGLSLIKSYQGGYFISGYSYDGTYRKKGWIQYLNANGDEIWENPFYIGGKQHDTANDLIQLQDGSIAFTGVTGFNGDGSGDIWLVKFQGEVLEEERGDVDLVILSEEIKETKLNQFVEPSERCYYEFELKNKGNKNAHGLVADVKVNNPPEGFFYYKKIKIGQIKRGATKKVRIPIRGDENLTDGQVTLNISLSSGRKVLENFSSLAIETKEALKPNLVLSKSEFSSLNGEGFQKDTRISLNIELSNDGDLVAENVRLQFGLRPQVYPLDTTLLKEIGTIAPGTSKNISFDFIVAGEYLHDSTTINCSVIEQRTGSRTNNKFTIGLAEKKLTHSIAPDLDRRENEKTDFLQIDWIRPTSSRVVDEDKPIRLTVQARSSVMLKKTDIKIKLYPDPTETKKDSKLDQGIPMFCKILKEENTGDFIATCSCDLVLQPGENKVKFKVENEIGKAETPEFSFQMKNRLILLAIGVPSNLKYTAKDASDFVEAYKSQNGKLYDTVDIRLCNTVENTKTQTLRKELRKLSNEFTFGDIQPNDQIIIFISSHGSTDDYGTNFRVHASDFDLKYDAETSLDFKTEVLDILADVKCRKLMFIDACKSGAVMNLLGAKTETNEIPDFSEILFNIIDEESVALRAIVSCSNTELSYEDKAWENGAFTKGLIEALQNKKVKNKRSEIFADTNKDKLLSIEEVYKFLTKRVSFLVKSVKGKSQNPYISKEYEYEKTPVYQLE